MAGNADTTLIQVPGKLRATEAVRLKTLIADRRGRPVALDYSQLKQVGTQSNQVLIDANDARRADGVPFEVKNMSGEIRGSLQICGLNPSQVGAKEAQNET